MSNALYPLRSLFWECTLRCNAYCAFCGSRCGDVSADELSGDAVRDVFCRIAQRMDASKIMINVTGGEPLLRRDLFDVMQYAHSLGFPWGMVTNGALITDEAISRMKQAGMRTISISVDGMRQHHESVRRLPGAFDRIMDAIDRLHEADFLDTIQVTTVVNKQNLSDLEALYQLLAQKPVDSWRIALIDPIGRGEMQHQLLLDTDDLCRLQQFMDAHAFSTGPVLTTSCAHYLGHFDRQYREHAFRCVTGQTVASILANGDIYVCPNVPRRPELIQGNVLHDDFVSVWENGFAWFRDASHRRTGECTECPHWRDCQGDSLHTWDFDAQAPKFCIRRHMTPQAHDMALPDAIRTALKPANDRLAGVKVSYGASSPRRVFFTPDATASLRQYFHWGEKHPANLCELMAALIGHRNGDACYVEALVPVYLKNRGRTTAAFTDRSHAETMEELDILNANLEDADPVYRMMDGPMALLGYIHSHPNELEPGMSIPDMELHQTLRAQTDGLFLTAIMNPQRRELRVYCDSPYMPIDAVLLTPAADADALKLI